MLKGVRKERPFGQTWMMLQMRAAPHPGQRSLDREMLQGGAELRKGSRASSGVKHAGTGHCYSLSSAPRRCTPSSSCCSSACARLHRVTP
eukprot:356155-Chlamydomonas_euryale.AAC.7